MFVFLLTTYDVFLGKLPNTSFFKRLKTKGFMIRLALSTWVSWNCETSSLAFSVLPFYFRQYITDELFIFINCLNI